MRKLLTSILLGLTLVVTPACNGLTGNVRSDVSWEQATPQKKAQLTIDNINAAITAADKTLVEKVQAGVIPYEDGYEYHNKLVAASKNLDQATTFVKLGDLTQADTQIKAAQAISSFVEQYLLQFTIKVPK